MSDAEIVATTHGYACRYTPTVCDGPVFRWSPVNDRLGFEVSASRNGVMFHGASPCFGLEGLGRLAGVVKLAARVHTRLASDDRGTDVCKLMIARETAQ